MAHLGSHTHQNSPLPTPPPENGDKKSAVRYRQIKSITLIGAWVNIFLSIIKVAVGYVGQSQALIADGLHSLSDLASDFIVLFAAKHGSRAADEKHPYGHGRIETVFTVVLGLFLIGVAIAIVVDTSMRLMDTKNLMHPGWLALITAAISIAAKEALFQFTHRIAIKTQSKLLEANAWHHRSDAISSILVFFGIAGSMLGIVYLDALAAMGMALFIVKIGWDLAFQSLQELVDTGLDQDRVELIENTIHSVSGVRSMRNLRSRKMGHEALVDVRVQVSPEISVSEGHYISETVQNQLLANIDEVADVIVHIDVESEAQAERSVKLPQREKILHIVRQQCGDIQEFAAVEKCVLHYLDGKIDLELTLPLQCVDDLTQAQNAAQRIADKARQIEHIRQVKVLFHATR